MTSVNCIQTHSGKRIDPFNPKPEDICLEDIAWALSMKCRFNGHTSRFYSVAEHCVRVSDLLNHNGYCAKIQMHGLLHDSGEAYFPDIPRPLKWRKESEDFCVAEVRLFGLIIRTLCPEIVETEIRRIEEIEKTVKWADNVLLATEGRDLMGNTDGWNLLEKPIKNKKIFPMSNFTAYKVFKHRFETLKGELSG